MFSLFHEAPNHAAAGLPSGQTRGGGGLELLQPASDRARSEERSNMGGKSGPRSRSADPHVGRSAASRISAMIQNFPPQPGSKERDGPMPKISEYRSQFAWPRLARPKPVLATVFSPVHQPSAETDAAAADGAAEDVPLLADNNDSADEKNDNNNFKKTEYKSKFRPFNSYIYIDGNWRRPSKANNKMEIEATNPWYSEVVERLHKAEQYRCRSHGGRPMMYSGDQVPLLDCWNQTRERSNLSELLMAQPITRREDKPAPHKTRPARTPSAAPLSRRTEHEGSERKKEKSQENKPPRPKSADPTIGTKSPRPHKPRQSKHPSAKSGAPKASEPAPGKIWLKPAAKEPEPPTVNGLSEAQAEDDKKSRPTSLSAPPESTELAEVPSGPVPLTTVRSPEEVTGVKSPDPESWTVPLETSKGLEWTDGQTPDASRATSPPVLPAPRPPSEPPYVVHKSPITTQPVALPPVETAAPSRSLASDVLDRARSRLDQFWSKNK